MPYDVNDRRVFGVSPVQFITSRRQLGTAFEQVVTFQYALIKDGGRFEGNERKTCHEPFTSR